MQAFQSPAFLSSFTTCVRTHEYYYLVLLVFKRYHMFVAFKDLLFTTEFIRFAHIVAGS